MDEHPSSAGPRCTHVQQGSVEEDWTHSEPHVQIYEATIYAEKTRRESGINPAIFNGRGFGQYRNHVEVGYGSEDHG